MKAIGVFCLLVASMLLSTAAEAVVKGGDRPSETCARRESNGTLTTGACNEVCKDKAIFEPDTDAEVDAVSSNGGVCNAAKKALPVLKPIEGTKSQTLSP